MSEALILNTTNGGRYLHDSIYESYIQAKIDAEDRLAFAMKEAMVISEADYSNIRALQEAKITDKIKVKWKKFIAFIKGIAAKFIESMSNILLDEKKYLEKYKDIILKKQPKDKMEYSYTGNYKVGINRLINTEVPIFSYDTYKSALESKENINLVNAIINDSEFKYDDGETLPEQFKAYFLAYDKGEQSGKFSELNMKDIYNFCYNFNKVKGIVDTDISRLEASTRAIESEINNILNSTNTTNETEEQKEATPSSDEQKKETPDANKPKGESALLENSENEKPHGLKIDNASTDPTSKMASTNNRDTEEENRSARTDADTAKSDNKDSSAITKAADKWIDVCRPLIAAKWTACQQIAKDYMDIIRAHVRSYGGQDKSSKEGNRSTQSASTYSKNSEVAKAKQDAEKAKQDAEKEANKNK